MTKPAKRIRLKTKLGRKIQEEPRGASEAISPFFSDEGDPQDEIATEFDLDSVYLEDILATRTEIYQASQESLRHRGVPEILTVFRYGAIQGGDVTSVTLDPGVARRGARTTSSGVYTYKIAKKDVLCDVDAIFWGQVFLEEELLVRPKDLMPVEGEILESLIQSIFENVLIEFST